MFFLKKYLAQLTHSRICREKLVFRVLGYLNPFDSHQTHPTQSYLWP
jgi:hypothetical protein